jgi:hypothetical protein
MPSIDICDVVSHSSPMSSDAASAAMGREASSDIESTKTAANSQPGSWLIILDGWFPDVSTRVKSIVRGASGSAAGA